MICRVGGFERNLLRRPRLGLFLVAKRLCRSAAVDQDEVPLQALRRLPRILIPGLASPGLLQGMRVQVDFGPCR